MLVLSLIVAFLLFLMAAALHCFLLHFLLRSNLHAVELSNLNVQLKASFHIYSLL